MSISLNNKELKNIIFINIMNKIIYIFAIKYKIQKK